MIALLCAAWREALAVKAVVKRAALRRLFDLAHGYLADVPPEFLRQAMRRSFNGDVAALRKACGEIPSILGDRTTDADRRLCALLASLADESAARAN